jgi:signal transduction histidine kinase
MKLSELKEQVEQSQKQGDVGNFSEKARNLEVILDIVKSINHSLILEDVLELVLENAIKLTNSERGFIVLANPLGKLEFRLGRNSTGKELFEENFNVSTSVVQDVYQSGQSRFIEGAQSDTNFDPSKSILKLQLETILCSPLVTDDKKIGVIYVDSKLLHKIKIREITDTFEILAGQAAIAIRNAQLYNGQVNAYNALQEANAQLIRAERRALKSSIDSEVGHSLQGLVHISLLETESLIRAIEKSQKELEETDPKADTVLFDRVKLKSKIANDSIRKIQKYAQALLETSIMDLNKDSGDLNKTIQSVIKYLSPMKKFNKIIFKTDFNPVPPCSYDSEQVQHLLVQLFTNSADVKTDATITIKTFYKDNSNYVVVEDDGPGFPQEKKAIFSEIPTSGSSGYGLFLCKSIVDRHNGKIEVIDNKAGTAIQFSLPVV